MGKIIATALYRYPPISKSNLISTISKAVMQYQVINQNQLSCHLSWFPSRTLQRNNDVGVLQSTLLWIDHTFSLFGRSFSRALIPHSYGFFDQHRVFQILCVKVQLLIICLSLLYLLAASRSAIIFFAESLSIRHSRTTSQSVFAHFFLDLEKSHFWPISH